MKTVILIPLIIAEIFLTKPVIAQNVTLNILTQNSGLVKKGETVYLDVSINNMSSTDSVPAYKLKPKISVPSNVSIEETGHNLPHGWTITSNSGADITLSNGKDRIPALARRTILILLKAKNAGGPSTISGQMLFSNGIAPGLIPGASTSGDSASDNISTTTCKTIK